MAKLDVKLNEECSNLWMRAFLTIPLMGGVKREDMPLIVLENKKAAHIIGKEEVLQMMKNHFVRVKENGVGGVVTQVKNEGDDISAGSYELFGEFCQTILSIDLN